MKNLLGKPIVRKKGKPAHIQVRDRLLSLILDGTFGPGEQIPPEPSIAEHFKVSRMTANKSILSLVNGGYLSRTRGRGTFVALLPDDSSDHKVKSDITKRKISIVIDADANYIAGDFRFNALFWGVQQTLTGNKYHVDVLRLDDFLSHTGSINHGLIAVEPSSKFQGALLRIHKSNVPLVILGSVWAEVPIPQVNCDNSLGIALAVNHLIKLGHRKIMFVGSVVDKNGEQLATGFRLICKSHQVPTVEDWIWIRESENDICDRMMNELPSILSTASGPTGIVCGCPKLALLAKSILQDEKLNIPNDVSVVSYDDPDFLNYSSPQMTTVKEPLTEMAVAACESLLKLMSGHSAEVGNKIFDPTLVVRKSTSPPPVAIRAEQ